MMHEYNILALLFHILRIHVHWRRRRLGGRLMRLAQLRMKWVVGLVTIVLVVRLVVIWIGRGWASSSGIGFSLRRNRAITAGLNTERRGHFLLGRGWRKARKRGRRDAGRIRPIVGGRRVGGVDIICGVIVVDRGDDLFVSGVVIRIRLPRPFYTEGTFLRLDIQKLACM